jgi:phospholipid transport system substrate-binding protein
LLAAALAVIGSVQVLATATEPPQVTVRTIFETVTTRIEGEGDTVSSAKIREIFETELSPHIDYQTIAKAILRKHWAQSSAEQQRSFIIAFEGYVINTYALFLGDGKKFRLKVDDNPLTKSNAAIVSATYTFGDDDEVPIQFRLLKHDDAWYLFDVTVDGVSLVKTFRSDFSYVARNGGIDAVIQTLNTKAAARAR